MRRIEVVAAVIQRGERVLAFRRAAHKRHGGLWEFPGGKVEPGEDDRAALARELLEELQVEVDVGELLWAGVVPGGAGLEIDIRFYRCRVAAGEPVLGPDDHDAVRSLSRAELPDLEWAPGDRQFVAMLHTGPSRPGG